MTTNIKTGAFILLLVSWILITCSDDEVTPREYPRVKTLEVNNITGLGATFNAEIIHQGNGNITEYGFVWGENEYPTIQSSEKRILAGDFTTGGFTAEISTTLKEGVTYYVRAYAKNGEYLVYGKKVSFLSLGSGAPSITNVRPVTGTLGDTILITGNNFSYLNTHNIVSFKDVKSRVIEVTDTTILTVVPDDLMEINSKILVQIAGNVATSEKTFTLLPPKITRISPGSAKSGDTLVIEGENFGNTTSHPKVYFNNNDKAIILSKGEDSIQLIVPDALTAETQIKVAVGPQEDLIDFNYLVPQVIDFEPKVVSWGDTVTAEVTNFTDNAELVKIKLGRQEFIPIASSQGKVSFAVPGTANQPNMSLNFVTAGFDLAFDDKLTLKKPEIIEMKPDTINPGETINFKVLNFHPDKNSFKLYYRNTYGHRAEMYLEPIYKPNSHIEIQVPQINYYEKNNVLTLYISVGNNAFQLNQDVIIRAPVIESFSPTEVNNTGDEVTIYGKNFGTDPFVYFGNDQLNIVEATDKMIKIKIPPNILNNELMTEYIEEKINVKSYGRNDWSDVPLVINHKTPWTYSDDNGLFDDNDFVFDQRIAFTMWDNESYGYLIGGRGELIHGIAIPYGQEKLTDFWRFNPNSQSWTRLRSWLQQDNQEEIIGAFSFGGNIYAFTDNKRLLLYSSETWSVLGSTNITDFKNYFELNNTPYIVSGGSIYKFDPNAAEMEKVATLALSAYCGISTYQFNGKQRIITCDDEEYEFDPLTNLISFIGTTSVNGRVLETNGHYFVLNFTDEELYSYDPLTRQASLISAFPHTPSANAFFIYAYFAIDGALYLRTAQRTFLKYDFNF